MFKYFSGLKDEAGEYLDNEKLEGFIDFFTQGKCPSFDCYRCNYCKDVASNALAFSKDNRFRLEKTINMLFEDFHSGRIFKINNKKNS